MAEQFYGMGKIPSNTSVFLKSFQHLYSFYVNLNYCEDTLDNVVVIGAVYVKLFLAFQGRMSFGQYTILIQT